MEMSNGRGLEYWRKRFGEERCGIFEIIEYGIMIAAVDCPDEFRLRRGRIAELLFSCESKQCVGCNNVELCVPVDVENGDEVDIWRGCGQMKNVSGKGCEKVGSFGYGVAEALSDEIEEGYQLVGEVLRIKEILSNSRDESESVLYESLRKLQFMGLTVDILTSTQIGKAVNVLRKHRSSDIRNLAKQLICLWTEMVDEWVNATEQILKEKNDGTPDSINPSVLDEEEGLPSPPMDEGVFFVNPHDIELSHFFEGMDDDGNLRNNGEFSKTRESVRKPPSVNQNATKPKTYPVTNTNGLGKQHVNVNGHNNQATISKPNKPLIVQSGPGRPQKINTEPQASYQAWNMASSQRNLVDGHRNKPKLTEVDLEATKKRLQDRYKQAENAKRQRTIQVLDAIPKQGVSHSKKPQGRTTNSNRHRLFGRR